MKGRPRKPLPQVNGRFVTARQAQALKSAARAEAAGNAGRARQLRLSLEAGLAQARDTEWLRGALAETTLLERARGVVVEQTGGRVRLLGRDGLETLRKAGTVDARRFVAGSAYRRWSEKASPRQGSSLATRPGGSRQANLPEEAALRIAQARRMLDRLDGAVMSHFAAQGRPALANDAVMVLREVAGLGRSVRGLAGSGARRAALTVRLVEALDVLAVALADRTAKVRLHGR